MFYTFFLNRSAAFNIRADPQLYAIQSGRFFLDCYGTNATSAYPYQMSHNSASEQVYILYLQELLCK